jgi:arginase
MSNEKKKVNIFSVPFEEGSANVGTALAPKYILDLGLDEILRSLGFKVSVGGGMGNSVGKEFTDKMSILKSSVFQTTKSGGFSLVIGGDHSIAIGSIAGAEKATSGDLGVIWIDAHADLNTHETTLSGHLHGMPAAAILGHGKKDLTSILDNKIKSENILFLGLKDLDLAEVNLISKEKLSHITIGDITENNLANTISKIDELFSRVENIWISLDMDAIDKEYAPGTSMATSGSLSYREITHILNYIGKKTNVVGMDVVEVVPQKDVRNKTGQLVIELVALCLGTKYDWYTKYMSENKINSK